MNVCHICKGSLEEQQVTRIQQFQGQWYLIENLPAKVCSQCGEIYYTPDVHDRVIRLISSGNAPVRVERLAVLDARP